MTFTEEITEREEHRDKLEAKQSTKQMARLLHSPEPNKRFVKRGILK